MTALRKTRRERWLVMLLLMGVAVGTVGTLGGCSAARGAFKSGQNEAQQGNWDAAVVHYTRAAREDPDNIEYRMALERALREAAHFHVQEARKFLASEDLEQAIDELSVATQLDPSNEYAQQELVAARQALSEREARRQEASEFQQTREQARQLLTTQPVLEPSSQAPINLRFAEDTSLQRIFEVLSTLSGINILFDEAFRDRRVSINLVDVSFREALDKLVLINRLFYKVVDPSTIIIIPDNAQKHRQYDDLVLRTFYVTNAEVNTVANMLRTIAGIQRVQPNPELQSITVRATPDQVAVAERIISLNDKSKSEIILDIEILEINRTKLLEFGLRASEYELGLTFDPAGSTEADGRTTFRLNRLASLDSSDWTVTFPSTAFYRFFKSNSEARLLASPKLRASEGQPAQLNLGQEVPIPVTSFVSQIGTGGVPNTPVTSFQYRNIGINIAITPRVYVNGEIELELTLETSSQLATRTIAGIELPVFGTRQVNNVVRLRDGETNLIGGLISQEDRNAISGLPGISDVPILNKIFSSNSRDSRQQDVVFSVTPQIIRAPRVSVEDLIALPMGTEQQIRVPGAQPSPFPPAPSAEDEEPVEPEPAAPAEDAEPAEPDEADEPADAAEPAEPAEPVDEAEPDASAEPAAEPDEPADEAGAAEPEPAETARVGPITVVFSPPRSEIALGERVELALIAGGAERLSSGQINMTYDATALQVVDVQPGPFLSIDGKQVSFVPVIDEGRIRIDFARENDPVGLRGSGHVLRLVLEAIAPGTLTVSAAGSFQDPEGGAIPASFAAARVIIME